MDKYAYERILGSRRINGTDFPIRVVVYKAHNHCWIRAVICNGVCETHAKFRTRREAVDDAIDPAA